MHSATRLAATPALLVFLVSVGCSSSDTTSNTIPISPTAVSSVGTGPARYPLQLGNRWTYAGKLETFVQVGDEWTPDFVVHSTIVDEVIGSEQIADREYVITRQTITDELRDEPIIRWIRSRQDRRGLYEADISLREPPSLAAGAQAEAANLLAGPATAHLLNSRAFRNAFATVEMKRSAAKMLLHPSYSARLRADALPGEITRLVYPLHTGVAWDVRTEPFRIRCEVEARDVLDLAIGNTPAWRVRATLEPFGESDQFLLWYGDDGYLESFLRVTSDAIDEEGNVLGKLLIEEREQLTGRYLSKH